MNQSSTPKHLALVPARKPRRKLRPLTFDNRDATATADRLNYSVIVPFCSVECKPETMDDYARALGKLSVNARRVYHTQISLSGMGKIIRHRLPAAGEIAARTHISESSAQRAIKELKRAGFIEEVELESDGDGARYFECNEPDHRHGDSSNHYISPGDQPVRIALHPLHESGRCVCGSARRACKVPNWYYAIGGVSPWAAEVALYQSGFGGIGIPSFAPRKHLVEHVMVGYSEDRAGRVLEALSRLGAKRTKQYRRGVQVASIFQLPANPPDGVTTLRDDCATPARVNLQAVRRKSPGNLPESQAPIHSVTGAHPLSQGRPSRQSQTPMLIDPRVEPRSDPISDGSPSATDGVSNFDSHTNTAIAAMKERAPAGVTPAQREAAREVARAQEAERARAASRAQEAEMRAEASRPKLTEAQEREIVELCELTNTAQADVLRQCLVSRGDLTPMYVANIRAMSAQDYEVMKPWLEKKAAAQPTSPDFKMTEARVGEIVSLCDATGADHAKLLAWYKVVAFEAMTADQYAAAKFGLENRLAKAKASRALAGWVDESPKAPTAPNRENVDHGSSSSSSDPV